MEGIEEGDEITFVWKDAKYEAHGLKLASNVAKTADQKALDGIEIKTLDIKVRDALTENPEGKSEIAKANKEAVEKAIKETVEKQNPGVTVTKVELPLITETNTVGKNDNGVTANVTLQEGNATKVIEGITVSYK